MAGGIEDQGVEVRPVFIIGAPRSATSTLVWAVGQHPRFQAMPETAWISSLAVGAFLSHRKGSERGRLSHLSNVEYEVAPFLAHVGRAVDAIVSDVFRRRCNIVYPGWEQTGKLVPRDPPPPWPIRRHVDEPKCRWIDGTPLNTQFTWALAQMFPCARFIHSLRRPDEVATSLEGFGNLGVEPRPLLEGVETWIQHTENAWFTERALGADRVFRVDFARLHTEPEALLEELFRFLEEETCAASLEPLRTRLNSSRVDDLRERNLAILGGMERFRTAEALYSQVVESPIPSTPDTTAETVIRQRFLDYCHDRSLV